MLQEIQNIRIKPSAWITAGIYAIILAFAYLHTLRNLIFVDWNRENYTHCYFIPFLVMFLIWNKRQQLNAVRTYSSWMGLIPFIAGVSFFWLGELGGAHVVLYFSLWFVIIGLLWMHLGWPTIRIIWFAIAMIPAMFPLPNFLTGHISHQLQLISLKLGVSVVKLFGLPASREGNYIEFGLNQMLVLEAGIGLRYFVLIMVSGLVLAYFFKAHTWKRIMLFLSSILLAIAVNSLGIALTAFLFSIWGATVAERFFDWFSGWMTFLLALAFLLIEMLVLWRICPAKKRKSSEEAQEEGPLGEETQEREPMHPCITASPRRRVSVCIVGILALGLTLGLSRAVEFREKMPAARPFNQFPMEIGEWTGRRQFMDQIFLNALFFNDYILANYQNREGREINLYVAYYDSQTKGESIQPPSTGLPARWTFRESKNAKVILIAHSLPSIEVNRAFMEKQGAKQLVYFWYPMRGRVLTEPYQVKLTNFWDAVTRRRTDGALVRVITPVHKGERMIDAEVRLAGFVREVVPILDQFIPQ